MLFYRGFSLLEVCVVIIILCTLATFTYSTEKNLITRAYRLEGKTALLILATQMEQYYALHQTYEKATLGVNPETDVAESSFSAEGHYQLSIQKANVSSFLLIATALTKDHDCPILTLNNLGIKGSQDGMCW